MDTAAAPKSETNVQAQDVTVEVLLKITHTVRVQVRTRTDRPMTEIADAALKAYQESGGRKWSASFSSNLAITPAESDAKVESFRTVKVERW